MRVLLHVNRDAGADEVLESLFFDVNPVLAGKQVHKVEQAVCAAGLGALLSCAEIGQGHLGIGNGGT